MICLVKLARCFIPATESIAIRVSTANSPLAQRLLLLKRERSVDRIANVDRELLTGNKDFYCRNRGLVVCANIGLVAKGLYGRYTKNERLALIHRESKSPRVA